MKDVFYFLLDLGEYSIRGYLLYIMVRVVSRVQKDSAFIEKRKGFLLVLQYILLRMTLDYMPGINKLLLGADSAVINSKQTITFLLAGLCFSIFFGCYYGSRVKKLAVYFVCVYYALGELVRFLVFVPANYLFQGLLKLIENNIQPDSIASINQGIGAMKALEVIWNVAFLVTYILLLLLVYKKFVRYFWFVKEKISKWEFAFLMAASISGFSFCIFIRTILFSYTGDEYKYLLEENPELGILIPFISILGILIIFSSVNLLGKLKKEQEEKNALLLYEERLSEMEEHVQEIERLYEGMRGMKHDMKNYIADIEGILGKEETLSEKSKLAVANYMEGLCISLEELDMKYKTGNPVTDTVINRYLHKAEKKGANIQCDFLYPKAFSIDSFDISILLNNGLENAVEALEGCNGDLYLSVSSYVKGNMFFVEIKNSFGGALLYKEEGEGFSTTKKETEYHGYGMKNMQKAVEKYYGKMEYKAEDGCFLLTAMLQGKRK